MPPRPRPTELGTLTIYDVEGVWKWSLTDPGGVPLADAAGSHPDRRSAERDAAAALEALLHSDLPAMRLRVANFLAGLDDADRAAVLRNADEIVRSRRPPADP